MNICPPKANFFPTKGQIPLTFAHMLKEILPAVVDLSLEVGNFLKTEQASLGLSDASFKGRSNDLVSRADKEAEERFVRGLRAILPEAGFIAEEGTSTERGDRFNWIIDPLDGTTNYLYGIPFWCTSVALTDGDEPVLGVIFDPMHAECFAAYRGGGAVLNGTPVSVSSQADMSKSLVAMGFPYDDRGRMRAYLEILETVNSRTRGIRRPGAAALDMAYLACGRFDAFYEYNLNPWDVAAGDILIREAGGTVTDFSGGGNYIFGKQILCTNGRIHENFQSLFKEWRTC